MSMSTSSAFPSIVTGFGYSPLATAVWRKDKATGLDYRDLSMSHASGDVLRARHYRTGGVAATTTALGESAAPFAFVFVLAGEVTLLEGDREPVKLQTLDTACRYGAGGSSQWQLSHSAELVEIIGNPAAAKVFGFETVKPGSWTITRDTEDNYTLGTGPRPYFKYRDLGTTAATGRRIHIHIVRSTRSMEGGTGWHNHSMGQIFYVLRGWADLLVENVPAVRMSAGDAMCVSPRMSHNVPAFSADYLVLEACIPADYDTIDVPPPG